ncbi:hypothetical protein PAMP_013051 [Pampus punctatissimus]
MLHICLACLSSAQESRVRMRPGRHRQRQKRLLSSTVNFQSGATTIKDVSDLEEGGSGRHFLTLQLSLLISPHATSLSHLYL